MLLLSAELSRLPCTSDNPLFEYANSITKVLDFCNVVRGDECRSPAFLTVTTHKLQNLLPSLIIHAACHLVEKHQSRETEEGHHETHLFLLRIRQVLRLDLFDALQSKVPEKFDHKETHTLSL